MIKCSTGNTGGIFMRFTIRDLLWLTLVVGLAAGWLAERSFARVFWLESADFQTRRGDGYMKEIGYKNLKILNMIIKKSV